MAATYMFRANISNAINKTFFTLFNGSGSSRIIRVYRIYFVSISTAALTGGMGSVMTLDRFTGTPGGGSAVTLIKHNTTSANVPAQITALNGNVAITGSLTTAGTLKTFVRSNDEPSAATLSNDELQQIYPLSIIWDGGYGDSNVEPITLRETEGLRLVSANAGTWVATTVDVIAEMTIT
jgi:hypothetical protein